MRSHSIGSRRYCKPPTRCSVAFPPRIRTDQTSIRGCLRSATESRTCTESPRPAPAEKFPIFPSNRGCALEACARPTKQSRLPRSHVSHSAPTPQSERRARPQSPVRARPAFRNSRSDSLRRSDRDRSRSAPEEMRMDRMLRSGFHPRIETAAGTPPARSPSAAVSQSPLEKAAPRTSRRDEFLLQFAFLSSHPIECPALSPPGETPGSPALAGLPAQSNAALGCERGRNACQKQFLRLLRGTYPLRSRLVLFVA